MSMAIRELGAELRVGIGSTEGGSGVPVPGWGQKDRKGKCPGQGSMWVLSKKPTELDSLQLNRDWTQLLTSPPQEPPWANRVCPRHTLVWESLTYWGFPGPLAFLAFGALRCCHWEQGACMYLWVMVCTDGGP